MKQVSSQTRFVRVALPVRRFATGLWGLMPKALSRKLLKLLRNGESLLSFAIRHLCLLRLGGSFRERSKLISEGEGAP